MLRFRSMVLILFCVYFLLPGSLNAQSPNGKNFGFGIVLGDPTGVTIKYWTQSTNAFVFDLGASYFGSPRIGVDYLWHFNAFNSSEVKLYAGPGAVLGIGEGDGFWYKDKEGFLHRDDSGIGVRGVFGINFIPRTTPLEIFVELGTLVGLAPDFGAAVDAALGFRFYP
jgi:hypothetical protein